jgi:hypothetical protein
MNTLKYAIAAALVVMLTGCLEVKQFPGWANGHYAGKPDNRVAHASFHNDKLAWNAAILDRNQRQNEYNRANP